jgi:hypothetical protein
VYTILLLSETTLNEHDARRVAELHGTDDVTVHLLIPADAEHNRLIEALDEIALGRLEEAFEEDEPTPKQAEQEAMHAVNASIDLLAAAGLTNAHGSITGSDPVPAAIEAVRTDSSDEVIVVSRPHLIESALHRDWASRLRDELKLPVLHAVSGTDRVIS